MVYNEKIDKLHQKIAKEIDKYQDLIEEYRQIIEENEDFDINLIDDIRQARQIKILSKNSPFAKKCEKKRRDYCHIQKQKIRHIKKNPSKYTLKKFLEAHGFSKKDLSLIQITNCRSRNKSKQKKCVERTNKRRDKAILLQKKWNEAQLPKK